MTRIPFEKMAAAGNDFIVVDARRRLSGLRRRWPAVSRELCDRRRGIGADGVLVLEPSAAADVRMRVFNPDGSEAEMCGNGARCVARYLQGGRDGAATIETKAGVLSARVRGRRVGLRMTDPTDLRLGLVVKAEGGRTRLGFVNTGVPHAVVRVPALQAVDVARVGRALRRHRAFAPRGANVNFMQPDPRRPNRIHIRTYERGVEGETPACGTGVVASAVVYALARYGAAARARPGVNGHWRHEWEIDVVPRSGDVLRVSFAVSPQGRRLRAHDVVLEGEAVRVFTGAIEWSQ